MISEALQIELIKKIATRVDEKGGSSYYTGGFVRDQLLNINCSDFDIEVYGLTKDDFEAILKEFGHYHVSGKAYPVYGFDHCRIDFSLCTKTIKEAVDRRDLTINALMRNVLTDELVDLCNGKDDLEKGILRMVNKETFIMDPLRVYRVARFKAVYGFEIEEETFELCKGMDVSDVFKERVYRETCKALMSDHPSYYFCTLQKMGKLSFYYKELDDMVALPQNKKYHQEDCFEHVMYVLDYAAYYRQYADYKLEFMFAALCHDLGKVPAATVDSEGVYHSYKHEQYSPALAEHMLSGFTDNKQLIFYVKDLSLNHMRPRVLFESNAKPKQRLQMCDDTYFPRDLLFLSLCDNLGKKSDHVYTKEKVKDYLAWCYNLLMEYRYFCSKRHLTGNDLIEMGFENKKLYKEILKRSRELQYSNTLADSVRQIAREYEGNGAKIRLFVEGLRKNNE